MLTAKKLERFIKTGALHVLYSENGGWYHHLRKFPGVLFDGNGYILFQVQEDYKNNPFLIHKKDLHIKDGISSLQGYQKFTSEERKKIESLNTSENKLDVSDNAWQIFINNANKAQSNKEIFTSPIHKKHYFIKSINTSVIVQRKNGKISEIGKSFFLNRIKDINRNKGKIGRESIKGNVAQISTLVFLHPNLKWSDDYNYILVTNISRKQRMFEAIKSDLDSINDENSEHFEGGAKKRLIIYYERDVKLREKAIQIHGLSCKVCNFNFKKHYGKYGEDYIEVHHIIPISKLIEPKLVNPKTDMIVVCSNCHRMIHRNKDVPLSITDLIAIIETSKLENSNNG